MKQLIFILIALFTAFIGYHIHGSVLWAIFDWFFWPFVWLKWLICHEVNLTIIKEAFAFFLN